MKARSKTSKLAGHIAIALYAQGRLVNVSVARRAVSRQHLESQNDHSPIAEA